MRFLAKTQLYEESDDPAVYSVTECALGERNGPSTPFYVVAMHLLFKGL